MGIENIGNTCWMNACLQLFIRLPESTNIVLHFGRYMKLKKMEDEKVLKNLKARMSETQLDKERTNFANINIAFRLLYEMLTDFPNFDTNLRSFRGKFNDMFEDRNQHDPSELAVRFFLEFEPFISLTKFSYVQTWIEADNEEEAILKSNILFQNKDLQENIDRFVASNKDNQSLLENEIGGYKSVRGQKENIFQMAPEPGKDLPDGLDAYFTELSSFEETEITEEMELFGQTKSRFKNIKVVVSFPKLMLIAITRTQFDSHVRKNSKLVNMQRNIELHGNNTYNMFGFIVHLGGGGSGHYISYVHSPEKKGWYCYDDETVSFYEDDKYDDMLVETRALRESKNDRIQDNRVFYIYRKMETS